MSHGRHAPHLHLLHGLLLCLHLCLHIGHLLAHRGFRGYKVVNIVVETLSILIDDPDASREQCHIEGCPRWDFLLQHWWHEFRVHLRGISWRGGLLWLCSFLYSFFALLCASFLAALAHCDRFFELGSLIVLIHFIDRCKKLIIL